MRFMLMVRASAESEAGQMPSAELVADMMKFNQEMAEAGVLLSLDGLHPSSKGARVTFSNGVATVTDGPFTETKELIGGYWLIQVNSKEEAIAWAKKSPAPMGRDREGTIEIRQVFDLSDFPPEIIDQEAIDKVSSSMADR